MTGTVHRTVPLLWVRVLHLLNRNIKEGAEAPSFIFGADDRTRTCTLARWNLNPMSLPIPPHPHIILLSSRATIDRPQICIENYTNRLIIPIKKFSPLRTTQQIANPRRFFQHTIPWDKQKILHSDLTIMTFSGSTPVRLAILRMKYARAQSMPTTKTTL